MKVLFTPTFKLVTQLLAAKRDLKLTAALVKLDRFDVVILDDIGYVQQSREEMEVLFTVLAERYKKKSVVITSNPVFSQWDQIFKDPMTTMAALKLAVATPQRRHWWHVLLRQISAHDDCDAVAALAARAGPHQLILPSAA